jgi:hypothetical protein
LRKLSCIAFGLWFLTGSMAWAQRPANPAFAKVSDQAGLPRVLLLGDSISIGYTLGVRQQLKGIANVHRPAENCSSTRTGVAAIERWLGDADWDVIHFNFGLHDLKYVVGDSAALVDLGTEGSRQQVPLDEYAGNLEKIVAKLEATGAKLVWCNTTPVPEGAQGRVPGDVARYNAAAQQIMEKHGIAMNDLYAFVLPQMEKLQRPKNVHFLPDGSAALAEHVADVIKQQLASVK